MESKIDNIGDNNEESSELLSLITSRKLFKSVLGDTEIKDLLRDKTTPPDLYVEAASIELTKILRKSSFDYGDGNWITSIISNKIVYNNTSASDALFPYIQVLFDIIDKINVNDLIESYFEKSSVSHQLIKEYLENKWKSNDIILPKLVKLVSSRIGFRLPIDSDQSILVDILEKIILSYTSKSLDLDDIKVAKVADIIVKLIPEIISNMYPVASLSLIDKAISMGLKKFNTDSLLFVTLPDIYDENRVNNLLSLRESDVDLNLLQNPKLSDSTLWHLYVRYAINNPKNIGIFFKDKKNIIEHIFKTKFGSSILGYIGNFTTEEDLNKSLEDLKIDNNLLNIVYETAINDKLLTDKDTLFAKLVYKNLGDDKAAAMLKHSSDYYAEYLYNIWNSETPRKNNAFLQAFLKFPRKDIRFKVIESLANQTWNGNYTTSTDKVNNLSDSEKALFRDNIIPVFIKDRARGVRNFAAKILEIISENDNPLELTLASGRKEAVLNYISKSDKITDETFNLCLDRGLKEYSKSNCKNILLSLASRRDLLENQHQKIFDIGFDWLTVQVLQTLKIIDKKLIFSVVSQGPAIERYMATLSIWSKEERKRFFDSGQYLDTLARNCANLDVDEVTTLLRLNNTTRYQLQNNSHYGYYLIQLDNFVKEHYK